ncbi:MAG: TonB-dependent receptor [Bacteroidota bacterium]
MTLHRALTCFPLLVALLSVPPGLALSAQTNTDTKIVGSVIDSETGEAIVGANVVLQGTTKGAATDIDGKFTISGVEPGTYTLVVSVISYAKKRLTDLVVESGKTVRIDVVMRSETIQLDVVEISAKAELGYEGALLTRQKRAASISDGISAEQIKRTPDATSSDALRRVTGISVVDNKFIFVRGTSERYSTARLNGASLASTEPDKKSFAFDLFPSNLIDNMIISKTFTPDVPGDFSGGLVDLTTIDFPNNLTVRLSVTPSYNTQTTGKTFHTYAGSSTDVLGYDNGTRQVPEGLPSNLNAQNFSESELEQFGKLFNNVWAPGTKSAPFNGSYSLSIGDGETILGKNFGLVASLSYRNSFSTVDIVRNDYELAGPKFEFRGNQSTFSVLWGGLINVSYKVNDNHKLSIKNLYNRSADDDVALLSGIDHLGFFDMKTTILRYVSRSVHSGTFSGEHYFKELGGVQFNWNASLSNATREEPDYRRTSYVRDVGTDDPYRILINSQPDPKNGGRFYSELNDRSKSLAGDVTLPLSDVRIKFGGLLERKDRDFAARVLGYIATFRTDFSLYYLPLDKVFAPENIHSRGFKISEYTSGSNRYDAAQNLSAGYLMTDAPFSVLGEKFRFVGGVRVENSMQELHSMNFAGTLPVSSVLDITDVLPSVNLTYIAGENTNFRAAFSRTVNRPEFRELAPFAYYDFTTGTTIYGNPNLQRALIQNYDLRFETFPQPGEILSVSLFYKNFEDAIEQVVVPGNALGAERTFANAKSARNYGVEFEVRKTLGFIADLLSDFSVTANYTRVRSNVDISGSALGYARSNRPLQGQSPYSVNAGLNYLNPASGTGITVSYNKNGARIIEVATIYDEDVVEESRDLVDLTVTQNIFGNFELKLSAKDVLGQEQIFSQGDKLARLNSRASSYSLGLSMKL